MSAVRQGRHSQVHHIGSQTVCTGQQQAVTACLLSGKTDTVAASLLSGMPGRHSQAHHISCQTVCTGLQQVPQPVSQTGQKKSAAGSCSMSAIRSGRHSQVHISSKTVCTCLQQAVAASLQSDMTDIHRYIPLKLY